MAIRFWASGLLTAAGGRAPRQAAGSAQLRDRDCANRGTKLGSPQRQPPAPAVYLADIPDAHHRGRKQARPAHGPGFPSSRTEPAISSRRSVAASNEFGLHLTPVSLQRAEGSHQDLRDRAAAGTRLWERARAARGMRPSNAERPVAMAEELRNRIESDAHGYVALDSRQSWTSA